MRILMLVERLRLGGLETHVITLSKALQDLGHTVFLMTPVVTSEMEELLQEYGLDCLLYPGPKETVNWMKDKGIDILHYHPAINDLSVDYIIRETGVPLILTSHGFFCSYMPVLIPYIDKLICVSRAVRAFQLKKNPELKDRARTIMNPIDVERFHPRNMLSEKTVVFLGRLGRDKYMVPNYVLKAIAGVRLLVVGAGPYSQKVKGKIIGAVSDVRPFIWQADVVVGESRVAMEAMACGKPVLIVGNYGYMGVVTPTNLKKFEYHNYMAFQRKRSRGNLALLARDIRILLGNSGLRDALGKWGREVIEGRYSARSITSEILNVYREVLKEDTTHGGLR